MVFSRRNEPDMPKCTTRVSPLSNRKRRYLARRVHVEDHPAAEPFLETVGKREADVPPPQFDLVNTSVERRRHQATPHSLDLGQFGHRGVPYLTAKEPARFFWVLVALTQRPRAIASSTHVGRRAAHPCRRRSHVLVVLDRSIRDFAITLDTDVICCPRSDQKPESTARTRTRSAPVASIMRRSKPTAAPLASGISARAARKSSSMG